MQDAGVFFQTPSEEVSKKIEESVREFFNEMEREVQDRDTYLDSNNKPLPVNLYDKVIELLIDNTQEGLELEPGEVFTSEYTLELFSTFALSESGLYTVVYSLDRSFRIFGSCTVSINLDKPLIEKIVFNRAKRVVPNDWKMTICHASEHPHLLITKGKFETRVYLFICDRIIDKTSKGIADILQNDHPWEAFHEPEVIGQVGKELIYLVSLKNIDKYWKDHREAIAGCLKG